MTNCILFIDETSGFLAAKQSTQFYKARKNNDLTKKMSFFAIDKPKDFFIDRF